MGGVELGLGGGVVGGFGHGLPSVGAEDQGRRRVLAAARGVSRGVSQRSRRLLELSGGADVGHFVLGRALDEISVVGRTSRLASGLTKLWQPVEQNTARATMVRPANESALRDGSAGETVEAAGTGSADGTRGAIDRGRGAQGGRARLARSRSPRSIKSDSQQGPKPGTVAQNVADDRADGLSRRRRDGRGES